MRMQRHFQAAPRGDRAGILHVSGNGYSLRIVVVPKLWASAFIPRMFIWESSQTELVIEVVETQQFIVSAQQVEQAQLLDRLAQLVASDPQVGGLLGLTQVKDGVDLHGPPEESLEVPLVVLGLHHGVVEVSATSTRTLSLGASSSAIDKLVLYDAFINTARQVANNQRTDYFWTQTSGPQVKGSPNVLDVSQFQAGANPNIRSRFQKITSRTPLMIFIASALQHIVLECAAHASHEIFDSTRASATELLYYWPSEAWSDNRALGILPQAQVMAVGHVETEALSLGQLVLAGRGQVSRSHSGSLLWFQVVINMPRLWEILVIRFLRSQGSSSVIDGNVSPENRRISAPAPWKGLSSSDRRPDFAFMELGEWHLGDAKYKRPNGTTPDAADVNQMFMYSQLATIDGVRPVQVNLFYPSRVATIVTGPFNGIQPAIPPLCVREVPFPSPSTASIE